MLREAAQYAKFAISYGKLRFARVEHDPAGAVRYFMENRDTHFLSLVKGAVFDRPSSPYHTLFRWAGCEYGDLEHAVRADGLETTMESLRKAGVYLLHDEFKGKRPIQRGSQTLDVQPEDFANPLYPGAVPTTSSASGTITRQSLESMLYRGVQEDLAYIELQAGQRKDVRISSILPSTEGLQRALMGVRRGQPIDKWFALWGTFRTSGHYQLMTRLLVLEAQVLGVKVPFHTPLPTDDFSPVARWLAFRKSQGFECMLTSGVSNAVRVAAAATDKGWDISGTIVRVAGETLTDAKRGVLEAAGTKPYPQYAITELGKVGSSCREMTEGNCVHVWQDAVAVIAYRKQAPLFGAEVDSLMFTTLLPFAPAVLVNVEMDDSGTLEPARCECSLSKVGLRQKLSNLFSYGKLTGQGMTLVAGDMLPILEELLPRRFGGIPTDYQLAEREGGHQTEIELRVHPRVGAPSEDEVRSFFLAELRKVHGGSLSSRNWSETNGFKVVFAPPFTSGSVNKVHSLHLLGRASNNERPERGRSSPL